MELCFFCLPIRIAIIEVYKYKHRVETSYGGLLETLRVCSAKVESFLFFDNFLLQVVLILFNSIFFKCIFNTKYQQGICRELERERVYLDESSHLLLSNRGEV